MGEDHRIGCRDHLGGERRRPGRALGLDLDPRARPGGGQLQGLGGHVGVGDTGRAGRHRDQPQPAVGSGRLRNGGHLRNGDRRLLPVDRRRDRDRALGVAQGAGEGRVHEPPGQRGEDLQVGVVRTGRCRDHEDQVGGPSVRGVEVHALGAAAEGQARLRDVGRSAVRDADPVAHPGRGLGLAGGDVGEEAFEVGDPALGDQPLGEGAQGFALVLGGEVEVNECGCDQSAGVAHGVGPSAGA